jgi:hypothetical protein
VEKIEMGYVGERILPALGDIPGSQQGSIEGFPVKGDQHLTGCQVLLNRQQVSRFFAGIAKKELSQLEVILLVPRNPN